MEIKLSDQLKEAAFNLAFGKGYDAAMEVLKIMLVPGQMNATDQKFLLRNMEICKKIIMEPDKDKGGS